MPHHYTAQELLTKIKELLEQTQKLTHELGARAAKRDEYIGILKWSKDPDAVREAERSIVFVEWRIAGVRHELDGIEGRLGEMLKERDARIGRQ